MTHPSQFVPLVKEIGGEDLAPQERIILHEGDDQLPEVFIIDDPEGEWFFGIVPPLLDELINVVSLQQKTNQEPALLLSSVLQM